MICNFRVGKVKENFFFNSKEMYYIKNETRDTLPTAVA
jgi:hypothetical protein